MIPLSRRRWGFTLVELLCVLAIIAVLAALAAPAISHTLRATNLTSTGQAVVDEFNLARQTAVSKNTMVEVRLYKVPGDDAPSSSSPTTYRGMQSFLVGGESAIPLGRPTMFPAPVLMSSGSSESSFLASTNHTEQSSALKLPGYGTNYLYRAFRFAPSGSADLQGSENFLTLVLQHDKPLDQGANFFTVQVNPINGSVRFFRP